MRGWLFALRMYVSVATMQVVAASVYMHARLKPACMQCAPSVAQQVGQRPAWDVPAGQLAEPSEADPQPRSVAARQGWIDPVGRRHQDGRSVAQGQHGQALGHRRIREGTQPMHACQSTIPLQKRH